MILAESHSLSRDGIICQNHLLGRKKKKKKIQHANNIIVSRRSESSKAGKKFWPRKSPMFVVSQFIGPFMRSPRYDTRKTFFGTGHQKWLTLQVFGRKDPLPFSYLPLWPREGGTSFIYPLSLFLSLSFLLSVLYEQSKEHHSLSLSPLSICITPSKGASVTQWPAA